MDVFNAFPSAVISGVWEIGQIARATEVGDIYTTANSLDVIVEEASDGRTHETPDADYLTTDTLIYAKPSQLPTTNPAALIGDYLLKNTETGQFYTIIGADLGKNQENNQLEHTELWIRATEAIEDEDGSE